MTTLSILENPALQQVVQKVSENGLHKVAEHIYGDELTLHSVVEKLATQWIYNNYKQQKIASGLAALNSVEAFRKKGGLLQLGGRQATKELIPQAGKAVEEAALPELLAASRTGIAGMPTSALKRPVGKTTFRGIDTPPMTTLPREMPLPAEAKKPLFGQYA